jgi:hypothetical protein
VSADLTNYLAMVQAEIGIESGFNVRYAVASAAESFKVPASELALQVLEKHAECERARVRLAAMNAVDAEIEHRSAKAVGYKFTDAQRAELSVRMRQAWVERREREAREAEPVRRKANGG